MLVDEQKGIRLLNYARTMVSSPRTVSNSWSFRTIELEDITRERILNWTKWQREECNYQGIKQPITKTTDSQKNTKVVRKSEVSNMKENLHLICILMYFEFNLSLQTPIHATEVKPNGDIISCIYNKVSLGSTVKNCV